MCVVCCWTLEFPLMEMNKVSVLLFMQVIRERDNLAKQLLRRNDERALLYEKIRIQQSLLSKGDFHYSQRMEDIRLLKLEIRRQQRKKSILDKSIPKTEELR